MSTQNDQTSVDVSDLERDIENCEWMINRLTRAIESGNAFSWNDRREFQNAWDARWRAVANADTDDVEVTLNERHVVRRAA